MSILVARWRSSSAGPLAVLAAMAIGSALLVAPAQAAFPGARGKIAFSRYDFANNTADIWTIDPDGGNPALLIPDGGLPAWSADGNRIAYNTNVGTAGIWVANADGSNPTFLTSGFGAAWAPDGKQLAFTRYGLHPTGHLWVVNADGTNARQLRTGAIYDPSWSPDGKRIVYTMPKSNGTQDVWIADADGRNPALVASPRFGANEPDWSPDGSSIAFETEYRIEIVDPQGGNARFVDPTRPDGGRVQIYRPVWSPDGTAFTFMSALGGSSLTDRIWTAGADGSNAVTVSDAPPGSGDDFPAWQPRPATASPSSLVYQARPDHTESPRRTATLTNNTGGPVDVSGVALSGTGASSFLADRDTCTGQTLADGQSCTAQVRFRPLGTGAKVAKLEFSDDGPFSPQSVTLSGTGTPGPWLQLSAQALKFGHWRVGATAPVQSVTLTNVGSAGLHVGAISIEGANPADFPGLTQNCLGITNLTPGQSCSAGTAFRPTAIGTRAGTLTITHTAPKSPHRVLLTGTGI
jgi:Tol biopolymer transport system component